jgi:hypothetical protein
MVIIMELIVWNVIKNIQYKYGTKQFKNKKSLDVNAMVSLKYAMYYGMRLWKNNLKTMLNM